MCLFLEPRDICSRRTKFSVSSAKYFLQKFVLLLLCYCSILLLCCLLQCSVVVVVYCSVLLLFYCSILLLLLFTAVFCCCCLLQYYMRNDEDLGTCLRVPRIRRGALEYYVDTETLKHSELIDTRATFRNVTKDRAL